ARARARARAGCRVRSGRAARADPFADRLRRGYFFANAAGSGAGSRTSIFEYVITPFTGSLTRPVDDFENVKPYFPVTFTFAPTAGSGNGTSTPHTSSLTSSFGGSF